MKYLVCNLKNKMGYQDFLKYNGGLERIEPNNIRLVVCPSSLYFVNLNKHKLKLGSQDISSLIEETVTGELTGKQLASIGVSYCIVGHSERRIFKKEINIDFINKINEAQNNGIKIIYCIGENIKEKENGKTEEVLKKQIQEVLNNINIKDIMIAYEPVWAIGTNILPSNTELDAIIKFIKKEIKNNYEVDMEILYGGSVNPSNIKELLKIEAIDGFLVGSASLEVENVQKMLDFMNKIAE